jgi:hypothetical protein
LGYWHGGYQIEQEDGYHCAEAFFDQKYSDFIELWLSEVVVLMVLVELSGVADKAVMCYFY